MVLLFLMQFLVRMVINIEVSLEDESMDTEKRV